MNTHFIYLPLEQFEVTSLVSLNAPILGYLNLSLTNLGLYSLLTVSLVLLLHFQSLNNLKILPSKWSTVLETSSASLHGLVKAQIGEKNEKFFPLIYSLFFFILIGNLIGNVPYSFTIATSAVVCLGLSFIVFIGVTLLGLSLHRIHFFSFFVPSGTPLFLVPVLVLIELISYLARALSLGVRLFSNMVAGHCLLLILSGFLISGFTSGILMFLVTLLPFAIFTALIGLEIAVSIIQSYVFSVLVCSYLKDSIDLH